MSTEKKRVHCPVKHVEFFIVRMNDGSHTIKCCFRKACGDTCPYIDNPDYKNPYRRSPAFKKDPSIQ
jgi:hypothetical protein